jgi:hypothetical protein
MDPETSLGAVFLTRFRDEEEVKGEKTSFGLVFTKKAGIILPNSMKTSSPPPIQMSVDSSAKL